MPSELPPVPRQAPGSPPAVVRAAGDGEPMHVLAEVATFRVGASETGGALSLVELETSPGGGVAPHAHPDTDELLYVVEGCYVLRVGSLSATLDVGACAFVPRGAVHAFDNPGPSSARLLIVSVPASSPERLFVELAGAFAAAPASPSRSPALADAIARIAASRGVSMHLPEER